MYEYTPLYYNGLQQIKFYDFNEKCYIGGLGYHDLFVDGRDGTTTSIESLMQLADQHNFSREDAIIELSWLDLNSKILGAENLINK